MLINEINIAKDKLKQAAVLYEEQRYEETLKILITILPVYFIHKLWKDYIDILIDIAIILLSLNRHEESILYLRKAIKSCQIQFNEKNLLEAQAYYVLALTNWEQNDFKNAILNHEKSLEIKKQLLGTINESYIQAYRQLGTCYGKIGLHNEALKFIFQSLQICKKSSKNLEQDTLNYNELGWNYLQKGDYPKALHYYHKILDIQHKLLGGKHIKRLHALNCIGVTYSRIGDLAQALQYYKESLSIAQHIITNDANIDDEIYWDLANAYHNVGFCYFRKGNLKQAMEYYQKALNQWLEICKSNDPVLAISYDKHALCFEKQGDTTKALAYYEQALNIRLEVFGEQHPDTARSYFNIGLLKSLEEQLSYFEKALQIHQALFGGKHPDIGATYEQIGKWYVTHLQWEKALNAFHEGICSLYEDWEANSPSIEMIPPFEKASDGAVLLQLLQAKSQCFQALYAASQQTTYQEATNAHIIAACDLIDYIRLGFKAEGSKLFLSKTTRKIYGEAIKTLLEGSLSKNKPSLAHAAFQIAEKSRAAVLLGNMKDFDAKIAANIPAELLEEEQQLKLELSYLDQQIQQAAFKQTDEETIQNWQSQYFQFKRKYDALIEQFEKEYPAYFQLKYDIETIEVATLQSSLAPQSAMIEYFVDEKRLYIFWVTRTQFKVFAVAGTESLEGTVRQAVRAINSGSQRRFSKAGLQLYGWLIHPIAHLLEGDKVIQHLIFIPDDCLFMLPFDALLQPKTKKHLIENYQISHHYSASLWHLFHQKRESQREHQMDSFLGFAPIVFGEKSLKGGTESPDTVSGYTMDSHSKHRIVLKSGESLEEMAALKESEIEVQKVFQLFESKKLKAKAFFYESANKANLLEQVENYKYILISTHGFVNKEAPSLSGLLLAKPPMNMPPDSVDIGGKRDLENANKLFLSETYHLPLSADLVVLSSCESGIGEVLKGEGMIALNRGFLHAGASNVLYSLIKIPQDATSELVQAFFQEILENSKTYPEALQSAKCQLIAKGYELRDWAGFALLSS